MSFIWESLHSDFDTDDGTLPGIILEGLSTLEIPIIYNFIRRYSQDVSYQGSYYWDKKNNCECPLSSVSNAAQLVVEGKAEGFHFVVAGLKFLDTIIPDLGVRILPYQVCLDYRMGEEWGPSQAEALFEFLYQLYLLAPNVRFETDYYSELGLSANNYFDLTFREYLATKK